MTYTCLRCNYEHDKLDNLKRHLDKKKLCKPILTNSSIEQCLESLKDTRFTNNILKKEITKLKLENRNLIIEKQEEQIKNLILESDLYYNCFGRIRRRKRKKYLKKRSNI